MSTRNSRYLFEFARTGESDRTIPTVTNQYRSRIGWRLVDSTIAALGWMNP